MAGVHKDTLLRWLRTNVVDEPKRDRRGWRSFAPREAAQVVAFAKGDERQAAKSISIEGEEALERLDAIEWDFANANTNYLTHAIHPYPAKFIPQIPNALIQELSSVGETVADTFCGSGTTLLEALQLKRNAVGIDANPLAALISRAKTTPVSETELEILKTHIFECRELLSRAEAVTGNLFHDRIPFKSDGWRPSMDVCEFWFEPFAVEELAELRKAIVAIPSKVITQLCQVVFASIIVGISKQDSDTRYVRREKTLRPGDAVRRYVGRIESSCTAVREMSGLIEDRFSCMVLNTDILKAPSLPEFDLLVTSPPYPNAYSYHLYHRTRLLWLGYEPTEFKQIEIGSHRKYSSKGLSRATPDTYKREFESVFCWLRDSLRNKRYACFVIGDSTVGGERVDNSSILASAGAKFGFREVKRIRRTIAPTRKSFNPRMGRIKNENILILKKV